MTFFIQFNVSLLTAGDIHRFTFAFTCMMLCIIGTKCHNKKAVNSFHRAEARVNGANVIVTPLANDTKCQMRYQFEASTIQNIYFSSLFFYLCTQYTSHCSNNHNEVTT